MCAHFKEKMGSIEVMQPRLLTKRKIFSGQLVSVATPAIRTGHVLHSLQTSWLRSTSQCWRLVVLRLLDWSNQRRRQHPHPLMQRLSRSTIYNGHNSSVARKILSCLLLSFQWVFNSFPRRKINQNIKWSCNQIETESRQNPDEDPNQTNQRRG